jgi:hypothetical protein
VHNEDGDKSVILQKQNLTIPHATKYRIIAKYTISNVRSGSDIRNGWVKGMQFKINTLNIVIFTIFSFY